MFSFMLTKKYCPIIVILEWYQKQEKNINTRLHKKTHPHTYVAVGLSNTNTNKLFYFKQFPLA